MRVRCVRIEIVGGTDHKQEVSTSPFVTKGKDYLVIAVLANPSSAVLPVGVQIINDEGHPSWWPSSMFVTVDTAIPSNWISKVDETGALHLAPAAWIEPGFWEAFSDGDPAAGEIYRRELEVIKRAI